MDNIAALESAIISIQRVIEIPFWSRWEFWLSFIVTAAGLLFSVLAFKEAQKAKDEARKAKDAATEAGKSVKIQTITIELTEIAQKLSSMATDIHFNEARDLHAEISRRLRRAISAFTKDPELGENIKNLKEALSKAKVSLNSVRPTDPTKEKDIPYNVYYAIENDFSLINDLVADLLGLFERKTIDWGENHAAE